MGWELRMKIAVGAARGLAFLHTTEEQVIFRDFKTSNILLDVVSMLFFFTYVVFYSQVISR